MSTQHLNEYQLRFELMDKENQLKESRRTVNALKAAITEPVDLSQKYARLCDEFAQAQDAMARQGSFLRRMVTEITWCIDNLTAGEGEVETDLVNEVVDRLAGLLETADI